MLWVGNIPAGGSIAVLSALYAVGAYEPRRVGLVAAVAVAELGVVMATRPLGTGRTSADHLRVAHRYRHGGMGAWCVYPHQAGIHHIGARPRGNSGTRAGSTGTSRYGSRASADLA